jgi:nicotinamide mononucleotide (NMN) deamidase PncC
VGVQQRSSNVQQTDSWFYPPDRGPTEDVASTLALGVKNKLNATMCIGEAGIAGPMSPSRRLPPGLTCLAIARDDGPAITKTVMTGVRDRIVNMHAFAEEALKLLHETLTKDKQSKL